MKPRTQRLGVAGVVLAIAITLLAACTPTATFNLTEGQSIQDTYLVQATVASDSGNPVTGVQFQVDGASRGPVLPAPPFQYAWDTTRDSNGSHTIAVRVTKQDGSTSNSNPVTVTINNPPPAQPIPGTVLIEGDSISKEGFDPDANGSLLPGAEAPTGDIRINASGGWSTNTPQIRQHVINNVRSGHSEVVVFALGTNDSGGLFDASGWTQEDVANFRTLMDELHPDSCAVFILPKALDHFQYPWWLTGINTARGDIQSPVDTIQEIAASRQFTEVIDWRNYMQAHPELVGTDGLHLLMSPDGVTTVPASAQMRRQANWDGVQACREQLAA